jgi:hypothetical protein
MKKLLLSTIILLSVSFLIAQTAQVKPGLKSEKSLTFQMISPDGPINYQAPASTPTLHQYKATDVVSIVDIGTSANAYGYANSGRANVNLNNDLNTVTNFHRMGGDLDPGGYSGDLGYDISTDGGMTWTTMHEVWVAQENAGGTYFLDAARYCQHGLYNPAGNTDPNEAYVTFFCPTTGTTNGATWGGYAYGRANVGDEMDTTRHFIQSPGNGIFYYVPDGFSLNNRDEYWVTDVNTDWTSGTGVYLDALMIAHGVWDEAEDDFVTELFPLECETVDAAAPANTGVEFSPDGQIGYIVALADIGEVEVSEGVSYYPVLYRTEDGGETWTDPIPVALAGEDGIPEILNYLSDAEIAELFVEPLPDRDEIPFTTAFDFEITVDAWGNPHIAVVIGVTGGDPYSILTGISPSSGYAFTSVFLLSSNDLGNEGSWHGYQLGRPVSFRGNFGELAEDNRIQISRDEMGYKIFAAWLDTDTTVSSENNAPDVWARGLDLMTNNLTADGNGEDKPTNVTFGSEATFSAYYFGMGNEVMNDGMGGYTIPFTYQNMTPTDPIQPVQFKYIQDFMFTDADFTIVGVEEHLANAVDFAEVSQNMPNPASDVTRFTVSLEAPQTVSVNVTNLMGQTVITLPAERLSQGTHNINLDVSSLVSGVYFYTLEAGNESITKKMIVE